MDTFSHEKGKFSSLVLFYSMGKFKCFLYFCVFFSVLSYSMGKFKCFLYSRVFFSSIVVLDFLLFLLILLLFFEKISIFLMCFFSIGFVSLDLIQNGSLLSLLSIDLLFISRKFQCFQFFFNYISGQWDSKWIPSFSSIILLDQVQNRFLSLLSIDLLYISKKFQYFQYIFPQLYF